MPEANRYKKSSYLIIKCHVKQETNHDICKTEKKPRRRTRGSIHRKVQNLTITFKVIVVLLLRLLNHYDDSYTICIYFT
jgi:hypothetical protein